MSKINTITVGGTSYDIEDTSKEALANKVSTIDAQSTNTEYPGAKAVYDFVGSLDTITVESTTNTRFETGSSGTFDFFSAKLGFYVPRTSLGQILYWSHRTNGVLSGSSFTNTADVLYFIKDVEINNSMTAFTHIGTMVAIIYDGNELHSLDIQYKYSSTDEQIKIVDNGSKGKFSFINNGTNMVYTQNINSIFNFKQIPKLQSYSAPTTDVQLTPKKYVDDQDKILLNNLAPTYDATSTYAVGDYVIYNNLLYVCNTAITVAEAWTAAHWTQTTVAEILGNLTTPSNSGGE